MASGDTLIAWQATAAHFPTSNAATFDTTGAGLPVLDFDDGIDETAYFAGVMPGHYGSQALTVTLAWKFSTFVGSQTCDWEVSFYRVADDADSVESYTFATAQTAIITEASATGELDYGAINFTHAQADSVAKNEFFVLRVTRDASGGTQGSPGDVELAFVEVKVQ